MRKSVMLMILLSLFIPQLAKAGEVSAEELFVKMRQKFTRIKDYTADVKMLVNVSYMKIPPLTGVLYYKAPDKMKFDRKGGIAIMPKKGVSFNMSSTMPTDDATVIDGGYSEINGVKVHVIKVIPNHEENDIVLTKVWVDEANILALRIETTTKENGTVKMDLEYGQYTKLALPDKVTLHVDEKEYKLPKGVTLDYDDLKEVSEAQKKQKNSLRKGKIVINYLSYKINTGLKDTIFTEK